MSRDKTSFGCFETPIIGGRYKGKKILIPDLHTTRSSKAILRESLFNTLQFDILDKRFVEVFAGSGSVGLEALSRGASEAYFIEKNREVYQLLTHNIRQIDPEHATALCGDSFALFPDLYRRLAAEESKSYFYFDPPFSTREGMEDIYTRTLELVALIQPQLCEKVIIEHMSRFKLPEQIGALSLRKQKRFGKSTLSYYTAL